jgi:nucleoid-associated protein YgaU
MQRTRGVQLDAAGKPVIHCAMKTIAILILGAVLAVFSAFGQDATQQQIDKLSGQIQDLLAAQGQMTKRLDAMEKEISDLRDKVNSPQVDNSASRDDLKHLADQLQEIDKKRQADRELILKEIGKLGKVSGAAVRSKPDNDADASPKSTDDNSSAASAGPQKGYYYTVQSGNTVAAIAKAYRDQGVKVTTSDILKANPKVDPSKLYVGQKIFIPDPNAK